MTFLQQMGGILRFGGLGAFVAAIVADTRHPVVVLRHAGQHDGGSTLLHSCRASVL